MEEVSQINSNFNEYLTVEFESFNLPDEAIYFIIPAQDDNEHLLFNMTALMNYSNHSMVIPVLAGQVNNPKVTEIFSALTQDFKTVLREEHVSLNKYNLDFSKPLIVHQKNNQVLFSKNIKDFEFDEIGSYLNSVTKKAQTI